MHDLTHGSLTRHILRSAGYTFLGMVFQTLYVLIDLYWVGRLGTTAVAAVGISGNIMFLVLAGSQMLGVGTTALVSHATGRRDRARAGLVFNQAQCLSLIMGAVFTLVALSLRGVYARTLGADDETVLLATGFLAWFVPAMGMQFGMVAMTAGLRGTGNFRTGTTIQATTVVLNLGLAPVLMFGWLGTPPMGVPGAALASLVASTIGVAWMAWHFRRPDAFIPLAPRTWRPRLDVWRDILRIGLPAGAEFAVIAAYMIFVYVVTRRFGASVQAGFGIGSRILQACILPALSVGFAAGAVAGQNFGARHADRVRTTFRIAASLGAFGMAACSIVIWTAGGTVVRAFTGDADVIRAGVDYLGVAAFSFVASGVVFVASSLFQAVGNTVPALVASLVRLALVIVPVSLMTRSPAFAPTWIWWVSATAVGVQLVLSVWLLRREFRRRLAFDTPVALHA